MSFMHRNSNEMWHDSCYRRVPYMPHRVFLLKTSLLKPNGSFGENNVKQQRAQSSEVVLVFAILVRGGPQTHDTTQLQIMFDSKVIFSPPPSGKDVDTYGSSFPLIKNVMSSSQNSDAVIITCHIWAEVDSGHLHYSTHY